MPFEAKQKYTPFCLLLTEGRTTLPNGLNVSEPSGLRQVTFATGLAAMILHCKTTSCPSTAVIVDGMLISGLTTK